jgi:hypothetical protein
LLESPSVTLVPAPLAGTAVVTGTLSESGFNGQTLILSK